MSEKPKLWGGAFAEPPNDLGWRFGRSISDDRNLWLEEIEVSIAHAEMLVKTQIIPHQAGQKILKVLTSLSEGDEWLDNYADAEDIHAAVETHLCTMIGEAAKYLTVARSRNDQIATVSRLWLARRVDEAVGEVISLQSTILELGKKHAGDLLLGTTHMQAAQPVTLGYHLMAYLWMLQRDKESLNSVKAQTMRHCPLGSCAIAGTSLPVDRDYTATKLGFDAPSPSAIDSVSDRDFIGDTFHAFAKVMQHLSRLCHELILWSTPQFGYVRIADAYSTGSSLMPQKRNPDMAELIRGRASQAIGAWTSFMSMMQGQPLAYNRDMQDDKPGLFEVAQLVMDSLRISQGMLKTATFDLGRMKSDAGSAGATATGLAEHFALRGMPFREAHEATGRIVRASLERGWDIICLTPNQMQELGFKADEVVARVLSPEGSIAARISSGGSAPAALAEQFLAAEHAIRV
ncbi:MAG: argininosuccinate lyase [Armatimonadota bacterium]|nr:argininosuccinate lyase [Armatimonadota bacterium]